MLIFVNKNKLINTTWSMRFNVTKAIVALPIFILIICLYNSCKNGHDYCKTEPKYKGDEPCTSITMNAYIENSGSIDGYVNGGTLFKTDLYAMLTDGNVNKVTFNYVNDKIYPQQCNARDFIMNVTPTTFKNQGGNRAYSDISEVVERVLANSPKQVALLASDFIFSPPANAESVKAYLNIQQQDVCNSLQKKLKNDSCFSVVMLQGMSKYNGYYWNVSNVPTKYEGERPYYVMLAGKRTALAKLLHSIEKNNSVHFKESYTEMGDAPVHYEVVKNNGTQNGTFILCKKGQHHHLKKCKINKNKKVFAFNVDVDFSNIPLSNKNLCNIANYTTSVKGYKVASVTILPNSKNGYTHRIKLEATDIKHIKAEHCDVILKKIFPEWINKSNDNEGSAPLLGKTFGLTYMMQGVQKAFTTTTPYYTKFTLCIE